MSKIIEKAMLLRFNDHYRRNNIMPDYVSAYRSGYSTETVLLNVSGCFSFCLDNMYVSISQ